MRSGLIVLASLTSLAVVACDHDRTPEVGVDTTLPDVPGKISGTASYPSDFDAPPLEVCAETLAAKLLQCAVATAGEPYTLAVPSGTYFVFARAKTKPAERAYYTEAVPCGLMVECASHSRIKVAVKEGAEVTGIDPGDWYGTSALANTLNETSSNQMDENAVEDDTAAEGPSEEDPNMSDSSEE